MVTADPSELRQLLEEDPTIVSERSRSDHKATLLHYVTANAIEDALQTSPSSIYNVLQKCSTEQRGIQEKRAFSVARVLIDRGAEIDSVAAAYGGGKLQTPLNWLVSSHHPAAAGVMRGLTEILCQAGAAIDGLDDDSSPVFTALGFGHTQAAEVLFSQGAKIDNLALAAASGELERVKEFFRGDRLVAGDTQRCSLAWFPLPRDDRQIAELALVLAAMSGHDDIVRFLIEAGVDKNAMPPGTHVTAAPLHTACLAGQKSTVKLLIELNCDPTLREPRYGGDALGWARQGGELQVIQEVGHYLTEFMRRREVENPATQAFIQAVKSEDPDELRRVTEEHHLTPQQLDGPWFDFDAPAIVLVKSKLPMVDALIKAGATSIRRAFGGLADLACSMTPIRNLPNN